MIVDLCSGGSVDIIDHPPPPSTTFVPSPNPPDALQCRIAAPLPKDGQTFNFGGPLQVGGIFMEALDSKMAKETESLPSFRGCIRNFRINGQVS